jgi:hemerythrin-like domain-containing protein
MAMMTDFDIRTEDMPANMLVLLEDYPRDSWEAHPGFKEKTQHWLGAHQMFRKLGALVRSETEHYLDKSREPDDFAGRLSYYGNALVGNLHGHHGWEDHSYFPELSAADPRFEAGLEILEKDHKELDIVLDRFTNVANRAMKLIQLDEVQAREEVGKLHGIAEAIEAFLARHLSDEEELAVPIILHHRLRG